MIIGVSGFASQGTEISPNLTYRHFISDPTHRLGFELRYSQNHLNEGPDEYVPEIGAIYSPQFSLGKLDFFCVASMVTLYRFNLNPDNRISKLFWGSRLGMGIAYKTLVIDLSYLFIPSEYRDNIFLPTRSTLGFGIGYQF